MHFDDSEKPGRKAALDKLMKMVGGMRADKLSSMKKPAGVAVEIEGSPAEEAGESAGEEASEMAPSEEEKAKIAELYHKYCE